MGFFGKKLLILGLAFIVLGSASAHAQNMPLPVRPPIMKSVFWNTLMGSAWGAIMGTTVAVNDDSDLREALVVGTTAGGMIGFGFGIFLVVRGVTFDPATLPIPGGIPLGATPLHSPHVVQNEIVPFSAEMQSAARLSSMQWKTTIFQMTF